MVIGDHGGVKEHGMCGKRNTMEPGRSIEVLGTKPEYANWKVLTNRNAEASMEVGPTDSTPSMGKPCAWGSGRAKLELR